MTPFKDRTSVVVTAVIVAAVAASFGYYFFQQYTNVVKFVPLEFIEARERGAQTAAKVVFLANQSLAGLEQIGGLDEVKNFNKALEYTMKELERNSQARQEALLLSTNLGTMAAYLQQIEPQRAQVLATEAVGNEVELVNRLIVFHDQLNQLFSLLETKFARKAKNNDDRVAELIDQINSEIKRINNLNQRFISLMERFDRFF